METIIKAATASGCPDGWDEASADLRMLDDRHLLSLVLAPVARDALGLAGALLDRFGSLAGVAAADVVTLREVQGASPDIAMCLRLMHELRVRASRIEACRRPVISSWDALVDYARTALADRPREQFRTLYLDRRNILIRDEFLAEGTVDHAPVYPREVIRRALELSASALILVHNHPSGDPAPSRADIDMTRKIVDAAQVFGLQVHDHLIVAREGTASFRSLGLM